MTLLPNRPLYVSLQPAQPPQVLLKLKGDYLHLTKLHVISSPRAIGPERITDLYIHGTYLSNGASVIDRISYV